MGIFEDQDPKEGGNAEDALRAVDTALLHDALLGCVRKSWLLSVGASRDGFAVSITVFDAGSKSRVWCEDTAAIERALTRVLEAATKVDGEVKPAPKKRAQKAK